MKRTGIVLTALLFLMLGNASAQNPVDPELKQVVEHFIAAVDKGDMATVAATYATDFLNVRVADEGGFARLTAPQILGMLKASVAAASETKAPGGASGVPRDTIPTRETVIHHAEIVGDIGFVIMTRVKNLGNGWEPLYYSLVWKKQDGKWLLEREFVHQRSVPKWR